tara:strand:- start:1405 stop:1578 length:174 start_codon:yes stop_codon:yes gene_type:complete
MTTEKSKEFFMERYDFIYSELNNLQDNMSTIEVATAKLLAELQELRLKEKEIFKDNG